MKTSKMMVQLFRKNVFRITFGVALAITGAFASDLPPPPVFVGGFSFQGRIVRWATLDTEMVYTQFQEGQDKLEQLDRQGYECEPQGSYWTKCTKLRADLPMPAVLLNQLAEKYRGKLKLTFGKVTAPPEPGSLSGNQYLWRFNQKFEINGLERISFRYLHMDRIAKLLMGDVELVIDESAHRARSFGFMESVSQETADTYGTVTYYVLLMLDPI